MADVLFFGAHPDDVELACGGTAARFAAAGKDVAIVDLTRGESGSRGTPEARAREAEAAARALGVATRECLGLPDLGLAGGDRAQLAAVVTCLRRHRPALVVAPHRADPHPDHVEASRLVTRACYVSGLARFDAPGDRHRPGRLLYALYRGTVAPHVVVDVTPVWERRMAAVRAHGSQLGAGEGPDTYLTDPGFLEEIEGRARALGAAIGVRYGEGFRGAGPVGVTRPEALLPAAQAVR